MPECQHCSSDRIMSINAKCSDRCMIEYKDMERCDYVPRYLGLGGGDYVKFEFCLDCGRIQGDFPMEEIDEL